MNQVKIFVSYSHRDTVHLQTEGLIGFLRGLERDESVHFWIDDSLKGGDQWDGNIQAALQSSHIALLLVSQAFLDSHYCLNVEVSSFLDRQRRSGLKIFPVLLSACEWDLHPWLANYQFLPGANETLEEDYCEAGIQKRMYLRIRKDLRAMIEQVQEEMTQRSTLQSKPSEVNAELRTVTLLQSSISVDRQKYGLDPGEELEFLYEAAPLFKERCLSEIELLGGYVVNMSDAGQILVCFGYPDAQELDSVKAVRAGLAILKATARLNQQLQLDWNAQLTVRAGVHTGLVIGKTGADTQQQLEYGQTSSIANLAMKAAPINTLVISDYTHKLVSGFFSVESHKGIMDADTAPKVVLWTVVADRGINTRFEAKGMNRRLPLVGRKQELALVLDRWRNASEGKGQLIAISAEAGLGKSRLMQEVKREVVRKGGQVFDCQCSMFTNTSPLYPIIRTLEQWLSIKDTDNEAEKLQKILSSLACFDLPADDTVPYFADLLQVPHPQQGKLAHLSPKQLKEQTLEAILSVLIQSASIAPLAIIVEDLHWADSSTLDCLNLLFGELPAAAICVAISARPEFNLPAAWQAQNYFSLLKLDQLNKEQVAEMIGKMAGGKNLPKEVFDAICRKTEGYPLFIEELTQMVLSSDALVEHPAHYALARPFETLTIPDTLHESLMARLNKLEGGRIIAQIGAVLGREFSFDLIKEVAPLEPDTLRELLGRLVTSGLFYRKGLLSKSIYVFKHALVQDSLYESLLRKERKRYHKRAAALLETTVVSTTQPELLAYHFREADAHELAVKYGTTAAEKAAKDSADLEVVHHVRDALRALSHLPENAKRNHLERRLQLLQGPALLALKGWSSPEIGQAYRRAHELCQAEDERPELFSIDRGLWAYYMVSSQLKDSLKIADQLMTLAEEADDDDLRIEAHTCYCDSYFWQGQPLKSLVHAEQGLAIYDLDTHHLSHSLEYGEDPSVVTLSYSMSVLWLSGKAELARTRLAYVQEHLDDYTHLFSKAFLMFGLSLYYVHTDDPAQALHHSTQLKELSTKQDFSQWLAVAKTHAGWGTARLGDVDAGIREIKEGIILFANGGGVVTTGISNSLVVDAYLYARRYAEALKHAEETLVLLGKIEERHYFSELLRQKAEALVALDGDAAAIELAFEASATEAHLQGLSVLAQRTANSYDRYKTAQCKTPAPPHYYSEVVE